MRISSLTLTNFRSYFGVSIPTDARRVLFAGLNGSGKSSIKNAVQWLLTGRCDITDGKGSGAEWLQPEGTNTVQVAAVTEPIGQIVRHAKNGTKELLVDGSVGDLGAVQVALLHRLKTNSAYIEAVTDTDYFLRLHHADAKRLILELLDVRVVIDDKPYTLEQLDAEYDKAFLNRKLTKGRLKAYAVPQAPTGEALPPVSAINDQLARLRQALSEKQRALGVTEGQRRTLESRLKATQIRAVVEDVPQIEEEIDQLDVLIRRMQAEADAAERIPTNDRERMEQLIATLTAHKPMKGCVLDPSVPCQTHKLTFTKRVKEYRAEVASLPPVEAPPEAVEPLQKLVLRRDWLSTRRDNSLRARAENDARAKEGQAIHAELGALGPALIDPEIETLQARIGKGELLRQHSQAYWDVVTRYEQAVKGKQELEAEVTALEAKCELLGPNGARVKALSDSVGAFTERINAFIQPFGWTVEFGFDPWTVTVNQRPLLTYSESEQFRLGIAIQLAIASLSGLSFAIIDRMDMLDVKNRNLAAKMILAAPVDQVFMLSTREPADVLPKAEGLLAYRLALDNGRTKVVEGL
jgi:DNA repair exonuclease SbcCD ATPase subunit